MQQFISLLSWRLFTAQYVSGVFPPIIRSSMTTVAASGFTFVSWWQSCCVRGRASRPAVPTTNTARLSPRYEGKPEAATAVIELLMMGGKTPEIYWAVYKRQDNKLINCCIWLVIYLDWRLYICVKLINKRPTENIKNCTVLSVAEREPLLSTKPSNLTNFIFF
jgi:hypothetical protein